jgi:type IX secretion system PorP/SprF family membrane protein
MKKILMTTLIVTVLCSFAFAQQRSAYNLYRENWLALNPAAFSEDFLIQSRTKVLSATGRYQWLGLEESPQTIGLQYQQVLEEHHLAIGGSLVNDQTGAIGSTELFANIAYQLMLDASGNQFLSLGLGTGVVQYRVDYSEITFQQETGNIPTGGLSVYYPDFSLGIFYYLDNTVYAGLSIPQVFQLGMDGENAMSPDRVPHYMGVVGGFIPMRTGRRFSYLEPSLMLRAVAGLPINIEANMRYNHQNVFWLGAGYNTAAGINAEVGYYFQWQKERLIRLGFGYTVRTDAVSQALGNTFELNATYSWGESGLVRCPVW